MSHLHAVFLITLLHHFSVRLNERKQQGINDNKKMAYLVDLKTISVGKVLPLTSKQLPPASLIQ